MTKKTMRALVKTGPHRGAELQRVPIPEYGPDDVLIKVKTAAICGTDAHIYSWDDWSASRIKPPLVFGHEFSGEIVALGEGVKDLQIGETVTAEGHFTCNKCFFCRTGQGHICQDVAILGVDTAGCFAEYVRIPACNVWRLNEAIAPEIASIMDPLGNAVHTTLIDEIVGNNVLITGCGPIGLSAVAICRFAGAQKIMATEINDFRIDLAYKFGADFVYNPLKDDVVSEVLKQTDDLGADVLLEMSGNEKAINDGFTALRKGGWSALLGLAPGKVKMDINDGIIFKGAKVYGINGRKMYDTWYKMEALLLGGLDVGPLITHEFAVEDFIEAFELVLSGSCGKVLLNF